MPRLTLRATCFAAAAAALAAVPAGVRANPLPAPIAVVEKPEQFDFFGQLWRAYAVTNRSDVSGPAVDILAIVVTNPQPGTEFLRWSALDLATEADWDAPMQSFVEGLTWREFFGGADFPGPANGYFMEYAVDDGLLFFDERSVPIGPGESSQGEFWFAGPLASQFLAAVVPAGTSRTGLNPATIGVIEGAASIPEPSAALIAGVLIAALTLVRPGAR